MKHYFSFGTFTADLRDSALCSPESWDVLRAGHPNFVIPETREAWLGGLGQGKDGDDASTRNCASDIADLFRKIGITHVHSVGVGGAPLEYNLKAIAPSLYLTASDYSYGSISRLRKVFTECDSILIFDVLNDDWSVLEKKGVKSATLMYRIDPCFKNEQWRSIFRAMHEADVQNIVFVPDELLSLVSITRTQKKRWKAWLQQTPLSFAGYNRTRRAFLNLWSGLYDYEEIVLGRMKSFYLTIK